MSTTMVAALSKSKERRRRSDFVNTISLSPSAKVFADCEVVARYEEVEGRPPAVLRRQTGSGRVLLSGVHWEVSWMQVKVSLSCGTARSVLAYYQRLHRPTFSSEFLPKF